MTNGRLSNRKGATSAYAHAVLKFDGVLPAEGIAEYARTRGEGPLGAIGDITEGLATVPGGGHAKLHTLEGGRVVADLRASLTSHRGECSDMKVLGRRHQRFGDLPRSASVHAPVATKARV